MPSETTSSQCSLLSTSRPQHSRRQEQPSSNAIEQASQSQPGVQVHKLRPSIRQHCPSEEPLMMPAFALTQAAVNVSLSTSATSELSGSASQHAQQPTVNNHDQLEVDDNQKHAVQASQSKAAKQPAPEHIVSDAPIIQVLSQLDTVKWDQVAAWAAGDSAQAAALVQQLGPKVAESVMSEPDRDCALLRLEAQVAQKKLALTGQQLQEARDEAAALHLQLVQLKASHQQLQISQEAASNRQQSGQSESQARLHSQLQQSQAHSGQLEAQLAAATQAGLRCQAEQSSQLKKLSEQHSSMLSQLRRDHEAQAEAATQHHQALLQAHTERLDQQNQAHTQQLLAQHASELQTRAAALTAQLQQQLQADAHKAASRSAADVAQGRQLLEKSDALLAAEKQKTAALKAQLKREGKESAAQLVELQGHHQALQKQAQATAKALEDEQRKASKTVRAAKASADADVMKLKQALTEAEQQRLEAVRQCEAEGHRSAVKIAQAGRNLKSAKQEAAEAQKQAEAARDAAGHAQSQLGQAGGQVTALHQELQALKARLASQAAVQQDAAISNMRSLEGRLSLQGQHSALLQSVLGTISNVLPATAAQHSRWQEEEEGLRQSGGESVQPQEVLKQVQNYMHQVQTHHDRWQQQEEEHAQQLASLMVAQEQLQGQLRQGEEAGTIAEQEIARQKGCIGTTRAQIAELEHALQQATSQAKDAKAGQACADEVTAACRAELLQLGSRLASELEQGSMWEGRAQGLQQALHQARLEEVQLQQHHSNALDEAAGKDEDIGALEQQLAMAESGRQEQQNASRGLTKQLEQATAQALMAESLAQALRTQLKAQQEESQTSGQLLQAVFTGLAEACSSSSTSPAYPQGLEPCSLSRQLAAGLPDEAMAQLAVSHVQAILSSNAAQQQQLSELTQQVEQYMAESAAAAEDVQATAQALSQLASVSPESPPALSHAVPSELSQGRRSSDSVARCQVRSLVHLAESVAKAHREQNQDLVCSQAQIEQLTQQLRQATSQVAEGEARLQASSAQGQGFEQQLARTQADLQQVQKEAAAKLSSMKAKLKSAAQAALLDQTRQQEQLSQLQLQLQEACHARVSLQEQVEAVSSEHQQLQASVAQQDGVSQQLQRQLTEAQESAEKLLLNSTGCESELRGQISELTGQKSDLSAQVHQLQQQQSTEMLELTACNSGLKTQLSLMQQQHAEALSNVSADVAAPLDKQLAASKQQLRHALQRLNAAEQQLRTQEVTTAEAESRAGRADALMKKGEERRAGLELDKRRLHVCVRDVRSEASGWEHKCLIAQEALAATQAEAARMQKQAAVSAATAHSQGQLLKQLQAAETALADSLGSSQKLLKELSELRAAHIAAQQDLEGQEAGISLPLHAGTKVRCKSAEQQLQHLQSVSDSVLAELESTRQSISASRGSTAGRAVDRRPLVARQLLSEPPATENDENAHPNSMQQLPDAEDAKSERIRQLHLTLGALIDERDELQDTLSSSASPQMARQLADAQAELQVLRKYAGNHSSGKAALAEWDP